MILALKITCISLILLGTIFSQTAYAYLDPGTGSFIFQIIIASLIGAFFTIKMFWTKIILFFKNLFSKKQKQ
jgi:hypothetical protein